MIATNVAALARRLREAYSGGAIPPLRGDLDPGDGLAAYAVQRANTRFWTETGRIIVGRKVGLTSPAVQRQLGVDQPDFGVLFADMAVSDGGNLQPSRVIQSRAEGEVALVLARDVNSPLMNIGEAAASVAYASSAIEIVDSRIADWKITFADTVADNGSSAYFVVGAEKHKLDRFEPGSCRMTLVVNGSVVSQGTGEACLGNPLNSLVWISHTLSGSGESLKAGDVILTGALGPMVTLHPGDNVRVEISGLGGCGFSFTESWQ